MIYFDFSGYRNERLIVVPVTWTEAPTTDDPLILDVEIVVTGEAFYSTTGERDDAFDVLADWFEVEAGTFAILYRHTDGNLSTSEIRISRSDCIQPPEVVDFVTTGNEFSFRVIAQRRIGTRVRRREVVSRDLAYTVTVTGGSGSIYAKLYSGGTAFTVTQTGEIGIDGNFLDAEESDAFGSFQIAKMSRVDLNVDPLTLHITSVFETNTTTLERPIQPQVLIDFSKCAYARTDTIGIDEVVTGALPIIGFDDSAADPITYIGLLHTTATGAASASVIDAASMTLSFSSFLAGRTIRLYGIEEASSITGSLTDYVSLATGYTLTTSFAEVTFDSSGTAFVDLTTLLQELIDDVVSWSASSPMQLWISDIGGVPTSGVDETAQMFTATVSVRAS